MGRRAFREKRSKFYGTKQVLTDINLPSHLAIHDLDASVVQLPAGGLTGQFLVKNSNADYDVSWSYNSLWPAIIDNGNSLNGPPYDSIIEGGTSGSTFDSTLDGGASI